MFGNVMSRDFTNRPFLFITSGPDSIRRRSQHYTDRHSSKEWLVISYRQGPSPDGTGRDLAENLWISKYHRTGTGKRQNSTEVKPLL